MTTEAQKLFEAAMHLPASDREALAGRLFDTLEGDDSDAEAAWAAEIARRIDQLDQGAVSAIPWLEAKRMIFEQPDAPSSP